MPNSTVRLLSKECFQIKGKIMEGVFFSPCIFLDRSRTLSSTTAENRSIRSSIAKIETIGLFSSATICTDCSNSIHCTNHFLHFDPTKFSWNSSRFHRNVIRSSPYKSKNVIDSFFLRHLSSHCHFLRHTNATTGKTKTKNS